MFYFLFQNFVSAFKTDQDRWYRIDTTVYNDDHIPPPPPTCIAYGTYSFCLSRFGMNCEMENE